MSITGVRRTSVDINMELLAEAVRLSGLTTNKSVIENALIEFVEKRRKKDLAEIKGEIEFADGYDYKQMRREKGGENE